MSKYTNEQVTEAIEKVVAEYGTEYVYDTWGEGCVYATDAVTPSCIVGHVVAVLDPEKLAELYEWDRCTEGDTAVGSAVDGGILDLSLDQERALRGAQVVQDSGRTWGEALESYKRRLEVGA